MGHVGWRSRTLPSCPQVLIHLVGPDVPEDLHGQALELPSLTKTTVTVCCWRSLYQDWAPRQAQRPGLVFAPNGGLAAYESWGPAVGYIREQKLPFYATDFCEEAAGRAARIFEGLFAAPVLNPFRSPQTCRGRDNLLPSQPNAFLLMPPRD